MGRIRLYRDEEILLGTGTEPVQNTVISGWRKAHQSILAFVDSLDLEFLPRFDAVLTAEFHGKNDSAFGGNRSFHGG